MRNSTVSNLSCIPNDSKDVMSQQLVQTRFGDDLNATPQEFLQFGRQTPREPWGWIRYHVDSQIDIAVGPRISPRLGAEGSNPRDPVSRGKLQDQVPLVRHRMKYPHHPHYIARSLHRNLMVHATRGST